MRDSDAWPDEPTEENPEERWGNPERDLPHVPQIRVPDAPEDVDIDPELARSFWVSVFFANVAVAAVAIGLLLVYFRGQLLVGGGVVVVGLVVFGRLVFYYREIRVQRAAATDENGGEHGDGDDDGDG